MTLGAAVIATVGNNALTTGGAEAAAPLLWLGSSKW